MGMCVLLHHWDCMKGCETLPARHYHSKAATLSEGTVCLSNVPIFSACQEMLQSPWNIWRSVCSGGAFPQVT